jgi:hypothetical protein
VKLVQQKGLAKVMKNGSLDQSKQVLPLPMSAKPSFNKTNVQQFRHG